MEHHLQLNEAMQKSCAFVCELVDIATSARSVAASYKPPMLVTRVRLPACALDPCGRVLLPRDRNEIAQMFSMWPKKQAEQAPWPNG